MSGATDSQVFIRPPNARDRAKFLDAVARSKRLHGRWVAAPSTAEQFKSYIERIHQPENEGFLICRREDDELVGVINLNQIVRGLFQSAYLGYYGFSPSAGRGLMTEGLQLVIRHSFTTMKLHRLEANVQPVNLASIALVKRCNFRLEGFSPRYLKIAGRWRDHERWAITLEDWRDARTAGKH